MAVSRMVKEGRLVQGEDEQIAYQVTTTPWGSNPSSASTKLYDITLNTRTDVTATKLSGSTTIDGDVVTTPYVLSLTAGHLYRLEIAFTCSGNIFECYVEIMGEY